LLFFAFQNAYASGSKKKVINAGILLAVLRPSQQAEMTLFESAGIYFVPAAPGAQQAGRFFR